MRNPFTFISRMAVLAALLAPGVWPIFGRHQLRTPADAKAWVKWVRGEAPRPRVRRGAADV